MFRRAMAKKMRARAEPRAGLRHYRMMNTNHTIRPAALAALLLASALTATVFTTSGCAGSATKESTGELVDDSAITLKVKAAFVNDPVVRARDVKVETFKGVVQLSGFVDTAEEKAQASRLAASVKGVTDVKNSIAVK